MAGREGEGIWVGIFAGTSAAATLILACATPFSSLAAISATRMSRCAGFVLIGAAWAVSQAIGFGVLGYPHDPRTLAWGLAILTASLVASEAARRGGDWVGGHPALRVATAFGAGFLGYKATLVAWSLVLGGVHTALSPYYALTQFGREALILAGLLGVHRLLTTLGVPAAPRARMA